MKAVVRVSRTSHKSLLNPWRTRQVWVLTLECGHQEFRSVSRFPTPPKRVKCHACEASGQAQEVEE